MSRLLTNLSANKGGNGQYLAVQHMVVLGRRCDYKSVSIKCLRVNYPYNCRAFNIHTRPPSGKVVSRHWVNCAFLYIPVPSNSDDYLGSGYYDKLCLSLSEAVAIIFFYI